MKKIVGLMSLVAVIFFSAFSVFAENDENEQLQQIQDELSQKIEQGIDGEIVAELEEENIDIYDFSTFSNIKTEDILDKILSILRLNISGIGKLTAKMVAVIILCSVVKNFVPTKGGCTENFSYISVICCATVLTTSFQECISSVVNTLECMSTFMNCYIPVYSCVIITSGNALSGTAYNVTMFSICQIIAYLSNNIILPVMSYALCFSIVGAINEEMAFGKVINGIKKIIQWILGVLMTVVVAVLSIQSVIGVSSDTVATKTAKYAVSTFVPFIGGAVSETYLTLKSSLGIIRSGIGSVGIIVILFLAVKPIIAILVMKMAVYLCEIVSEMLDEKAMASFMSNISSLMSICLSTIISISISFIISTALLMIICNNSI